MKKAEKTVTLKGDGSIMTALRQEAIQLMEQIPSVIQYMKVLKSNVIKTRQFSHTNVSLTPEMKAFLELEQMLVPVQEELDYDKELAEARREKYGYIDWHECCIRFSDNEESLL